MPQLENEREEVVHYPRGKSFPTFLKIFIGFAHDPADNCLAFLYAGIFDTLNGSATFLNSDVN